MLVEGAVELIIEDVVAVVDVDWEMMAAILVLELDAVRGVVGIGDFTVYVSDGDGCQSATYLNDVDMRERRSWEKCLASSKNGEHRACGEEEHPLMMERVS